MIELDPNYSQGWVHLSGYYNRLAFYDTDDSRFGEFVEESMATARKAIEVGPNEASGYVALGFGHWRLQQRADAENAYRKALAIDPNNEGALAGLGLLVHRQNPEEGYRLFKRSQVIDPTNTITYRLLYFALTSMGRLEEGIAELQKGIAQEPDFFLLYEDLAHAYSDGLGHHDRAAGVMSDLLRIDPESRAGMNAIAHAWYIVNDLSRASAWLDALLERHPSDADALRLRVEILRNRGETDAAIASAEDLSSRRFATLSRNYLLLELCMSHRMLCVRSSTCAFLSDFSNA